MGYFEYLCQGCGRHSISEWETAFGAKTGAGAHAVKCMKKRKVKTVTFSILLYASGSKQQTVVKEETFNK